MVKRISIFLVWNACFFSGFAQSEDSIMIKKISDEILLNGQSYQNLYSLCKTVGSRLTGSVGMYKAEAWGVKVLQAAGAENVYLQQCMVPHWVRGEKEFAEFQIKRTKVAPQFNIASLGGAVGTG
ncbi:MAG: peptidase M28 family protein, partial [Ferruginibacter sp.]